MCLGNILDSFKLKRHFVSGILFALLENYLREIETFLYIVPCGLSVIQKRIRKIRGQLSEYHIYVIYKESLISDYFLIHQFSIFNSIRLCF